MSPVLEPLTISFPEGYDSQAEFETPFRGYLRDVIVQLADGSRYQLYFIDLARLEQSLADNVQGGRPFYTEPGLVILPEVTTQAIREVVQGLWKEGYFRLIKPL
jgi:hypothetical protein